MEYYRQGVDIQEDGRAVDMALAQEYDGAYYLRDRSYGILEIMVVEMKFRRSHDVGLLQNANFRSNAMSEHMSFAEQEVGLPYATKVSVIYRRTVHINSAFQLEKGRHISVIIDLSCNMCHWRQAQFPESNGITKFYVHSMVNFYGQRINICFFVG